MVPWRVVDSRKDPLERRELARATVVIVLVAAAATFALSIVAGVPRRLPGVALGSPFVLHAERAIAVGGIVAALLVFAVRGWAGYFPSRISTGGAEYLGPPPVVEVAEGGDAVYQEIERLSQVHTDLAARTQERLAEIERELAVTRTAVDDHGSRDDML